jgi:acyl-CoA dehydrogenase
MLRCNAPAFSSASRSMSSARELMGPAGYSRKLLLEKWMRDAKINDLFEGTGQINRLIIARRLLGYSSAQLK